MMKSNKKIITKSIAFFSPNLTGGGAERIISILTTHFSKNKFSVDLLLADATGPYLKKIPKEVRTINFNYKKVLFCLPKLVNYIRKEKPDILFSSHMHCSTIALLAVIISGVPTKVIVRQPTMLQPWYEKQSFNSKIRIKFLLWLAKRWAYKVVVTSKIMADELLSISNIPPNKISIIYNPLPIKHIQEKSNELIDHPWFQKDKPPVILAVGRLVYVKDFQTLIKAFSIVKEKTDARLVILGEGPLEKELKQLIESLGIKSYVEMLGFAENPFQYMKHSKVFVMSSLWEGFPNSMIEAMACSTNIVATNCQGGTAEILEYGKYGALVPVRDPQKMAEAINKALMKNDDTNLEVVNKFDVSVILDNFVSLIS